jgi:hypothetical protein
MVVFKQMSGLETLVIEGEKGIVEEDTTRISTVACVNLRVLTLCCQQPKRLLSTIAKQCAKLTRCYLEDRYNIDDEDICQLSKSCPDLRELHLHFAERITTGLGYLAELPQLESLELCYTMGKYLSKPVLLNFAKSCPKLEILVVSDWKPSFRSLRPRPFEAAPLESLFPAAVELPSYFEPKISMNLEYFPDRLDEYNVRIDKLREDVLQLQQLKGRLGRTLVTSFFCNC